MVVNMRIYISNLQLRKFDFVNRIYKLNLPWLYGKQDALPLIEGGLIYGTHKRLLRENNLPNFTFTITKWVNEIRSRKTSR